MKVIVTGGDGFIGRAVMRRLDELGHEAESFDRPRDVRAFAAEGDAVIHLAGVLGTSELYDDPDLAVDVNVKGTLRVLEACRDQHMRYVGITVPNVWANVYQATKLCAFTLAQAFHRDFGVPVSHVRAFNVYGEGQKSYPQKIIPTFSQRAHSRLPLPIWGDGEQTVDLVHVDHVAQCLAGALELHVAGEVIDAGSGVETRVIDAARRVCEIAEAPFLVEFLPMRPGEPPHTRLRAETAHSFGKPFDRLEEVVRSYALVKV